MTLNNENTLIQKINKKYFGKHARNPERFTEVNS